nr:protein mono-ADP-ribosyltransferase PARP10 [Anolis sagrei ordinatus]
MASPSPACPWVEVRGFPPEAAEELLVLYFENRRRSGGGPVRDFRRKGPRALLAFEQASDAERVLSRAEHVLQGVRLEVRPGPPRDQKKVLLYGLSPQSSQDLVELYVEHMLKCDRGAYSLFRSPDGRQALVQLQRPISHAEFLSLAEQVGGRPLEGSTLCLEWLEQTESLLVRSQGGKEPLQKDLLELYFESKRSGGGPVREVHLLPGGLTAIVTFQERETVERVLQQGSHQLPGVALDVCPHYDFLEPPQEKEKEEEEEEVWEVPNGGEAEGGMEALPEEALQLTWISLPEEVPPRLLQSDLVLQELTSPVPECSLRLEGLQLCISGGDSTTRSRLEAHIRGVLRETVMELVPLPDWTTADFLRREDVQQGLAERLAERRVAACFLPPDKSGVSVTVVALTAFQARQAASLLGSFLRRFSLPLLERHLPALASSAWERLQAELRLCLLRPAEDGTRLEGVALSGLEDENAERAEAFLRESAPDETLVAMEPGQLRFLQLYHREVLAGLTHLAPLPIEGKDVTGLRLSGGSRACQAGAELLQSLLGAIHSQTVLLPRLPGISRFLLEDRGRAIVQGLEPRFHCAVGLERIRWSPPEGRHELEMSQEPLALDCERDSPHGLQCLGVQGVTQRNQSGASLVEIKGLLAALQPPSAAPSLPAEEEEDLYTAMEQVPADAPQKEEVTGEEEVQVGPLDLEAMEEGPLPLEELARVKRATEDEEEAQLLLAIQESMDSARQEEEEIRRATELSLLSWERERRPDSEEEEAALLSAVNDSLEANDEATLVVWAESAGAAEGLREALEVALLAQVREEEVSHEALRRLPPLCRDYLTHLERKHGVRIALDGDKANLRGFADHPVAATRDLALLLARFLPAETPVGGAQWVRWEASGQGSPMPYSAQASAILERAWQRGLRRVDLFFGGRPFAFDFHRMEEYDVSNARTLPIGRMEAPADPDPMGPLAEDEVKLVPLVEGSEEFRDTVRRFYDTLEELHSKIRIVKVEKLVHPLLYRQYQLKKAAMEKACGHQEVERVLYHGTTEQSTREICQHGFNRSFCGKNATLYGHGVYFARKACLSVKEQYSPSGPSGNKHVFVARTLVGDFTAGRIGLRAPPFREEDEGEGEKEGGAPRRRYDSTVDCPHDPSIFVIFNDTQAYPQFLITCQWSKLR